MRADTVLAIARDGELVCWKCMTPEEMDVACDRAEIDDVSVMFASNVEGPETCGRCLMVIAGTEEDEVA